MRKSCLIIVEYWSPSLSWLMRGLQLMPNSELKGWRFFCTDPRWLRGQADCLFENDNGRIVFEPVSVAYPALARGEYSCIVATDICQTFFVFEGLRTAPTVVMLDGSDMLYTRSEFIDNPCVKIVLKAQHPVRSPCVATSVSTRTATDEEAKKITPWPYFGSTPSLADSIQWKSNEYPHRPYVFYRGWAYPPLRPAHIEALIKAGVPFVGGLHERTEHPHIKALCSTSIIVERQEQGAWAAEMANADVALELPGNGPHTHRFVEALMLGCPVLAKKKQARFASTPPTDNEVCWFEDEKDMIVKAQILLSDKNAREQLSRNGRLYYEKHLSPQSHALRLIDILERHAQ